MTSLKPVSIMLLLLPIIRNKKWRKIWGAFQCWGQPCVCFCCVFPSLKHKFQSSVCNDYQRGWFPFVEEVFCVLFLSSIAAWTSAWSLLLFFKCAHGPFYFSAETARLETIRNLFPLQAQPLAALAKQSLALWPPPCINMAWVTVGDITPPLSTRELVSGKPTNPRMHSLLACSPTPRTIYRCQSGLFLHRYCLNGLMIAPRSHSCPAFILLCACVCVGMHVRQGHDEIGRCALGEGAYQCPWGWQPRSVVLQFCCSLLQVRRWVILFCTWYGGMHMLL